MIKLKDKITSLMNLEGTIKALRDLNHLIKYYSDGKIGPAYLTARYVGSPEVEFQVDQEFMVPALQAQRESLVAYLATLGIDASDYTETR